LHADVYEEHTASIFELQRLYLCTLGKNSIPKYFTNTRVYITGFCMKI